MSKRFVKEYANYKIGILKSMEKNFPEKAFALTAQMVLIKQCVKKWEQGMVSTDEAMAYIADI